VEAILWDHNEVIPDVKTTDSVIDAVVGANPSDDHGVPTGAEVQPLEYCFQRGLVKAVVGGLLDHLLNGKGLQLFDEFDAGGILQQGLLFPEDCEFWVVL
jgi:hypothetical protein